MRIAVKKVSVLRSLVHHSEETSSTTALILDSLRSCIWLFSRSMLSEQYIDLLLLAQLVDPMLQLFEIQDVLVLHPRVADNLTELNRARVEMLQQLAEDVSFA